MPRKWTAEDVLVMSRGFQCSCVLVAAAELELFDLLANESLTAGDVAGRISADQRATTVLLDALAALGLLDKQAQRYAVPAEVGALLTADGARSVLAMVQHQGNCLRRWVQLPAVVLSGAPAEARPSVRGEAADKAAFIGAMDNISGPVADEVIQAVPLEFEHLLDVGGGPGTWTLAFLRAVPAARATLFDLPHVIPLARQRIDAAGFGDRVALVAGDFYTDPLPAGADLAWVSAIVHQNSRSQNRALFASVFQALAPGGHIAIRDLLMDEARTSPTGGALFAINMLVATKGGGTFTFEELADDLASAGFADAAVRRRDKWMNSIVTAVKR